MPKNSPMQVAGKASLYTFSLYRIILAQYYFGFVSDTITEGLFLLEVRTYASTDDMNTAMSSLWYCNTNIVSRLLESTRWPATPGCQNRETSLYFPLDASNNGFQRELVKLYLLFQTCSLYDTLRYSFVYSC